MHNFSYNQFSTQKVDLTYKVYAFCIFTQNCREKDSKEMSEKRGGDDPPSKQGGLTKMGEIEKGGLW